MLPTRTTSSLSRNIRTHQLIIRKIDGTRPSLAGKCRGGFCGFVHTKQQRLLSTRRPTATRLSFSFIEPQTKYVSDTSISRKTSLGELGETLCSNSQESSVSDTLSEATLSGFLLERAENPRLTKSAHYKDRKIALERAIQVSFEATRNRYGWEKMYNRDGSEKLGILILGESLFSEPYQNYSKKRDQPSEGPQGEAVETCHNDVFLDAKRAGESFPFPCIKRKEGGWKIEPPKGMKREFTHRKKFSRLGEIFDLQKRLADPEAKRYKEYFVQHIQNALKDGKRFGAVVLEPLMTGYHTKVFVDPLFQHVLIQVVRENPEFFSLRGPFKNSNPHDWSGLPIIFSESSGPDQRLGRFSSGSFLQLQPDISLIRSVKSHYHRGVSKSTTMLVSSSLSKDLDVVQSEVIRNKIEVIKNKLETEDSDVALLKFIENEWDIYQPEVSKPKKPVANARYESFKKDWEFENDGVAVLSGQDKIWSIWSNDFVCRAARSSNVSSLMALGSVLTITVRVARLENGMTGMSEEKFLILKDKIFRIVEADPGRIHFRSSTNIMTIWPGSDLDKEKLREVEALLEELLLGKPAML